MKIVVTGSLGHISKPLTEELVQKGNDVVVISSNPQKQNDIEALGATAAIGTVEDVDFLTSTFKGADAVYCMLPPGNFHDKNFDIMAFSRNIANNYVQAILQSGVKHVVHLSSIGAHTDKGNGLLAFHYLIETILQELPSNVAITTMRPVAFYYNLYAFTNLIKTQDMMASNYGSDDKVPWVSPVDIAAAVAEELTALQQGRKVRYVASDEPACNEIASTLGAAIGKPHLKWITISNEQMQSGMEAAGMNPSIAAGLVEMNAAMHSGELFEDYYRNKPTFGKIKITDFAKEFAAVYNQ